MINGFYVFEKEKIDDIAEKIATDSQGIRRDELLFIYFIFLYGVQ